jgi:FkbM family methyltransferase
MLLERGRKWKVSARKLLLRVKLFFDESADVAFEAQSGGPLGRPFTMRSRKFQDQVCTNLIRHGWEGYEQPLPDLVAKIISQKASIFVDVGANTGFYSLLAISAGSDAVYAYEPIPEIAEMLRENAQASGFLGNLHIRTCALTSGSGTFQVWIPKGSSFVETSASLDPSFRKNVTCRSIDGDTFDNQLLVDLEHRRVRGVNILVKIDVENCEHLVLIGMKKTLELLRPLLVLELLDDNPHRGEILRILKDANYAGVQWKEISESFRHSSASAKQTNFLFAPEELRPEVLSLVSNSSLLKPRRPMTTP